MAYRAVARRGGGAWCHGNSLNDLAAVDEELVVDTV